MNGEAVATRKGFLLLPRGDVCHSHSAIPQAGKKTVLLQPLPFPETVNSGSNLRCQLAILVGRSQIGVRVDQPALQLCLSAAGRHAPAITYWGAA